MFRKYYLKIIVECIDRSINESFGFMKLIVDFERNGRFWYEIYEVCITNIVCKFWILNLILICELLLNITSWAYCISRGKPGKVQFRRIPEIAIVLIVMTAASRGANLAESSLGESRRQLVHCIPDCYISRGKPGIIQFRRIPEVNVTLMYRYWNVCWVYGQK